MTGDYAKMFRPWLWTALILIVGWLPVLAQDAPADSSAAVADTTAGTAAEEVPEETTIKSKLSLTADQFPDGSIELKALLRAKIEGSYQKIPDRKVTFFTLTAEGEESPVGDHKTGADGICGVKLEKSKLAKGEDGSYAFIARFDGDNTLESSESDLALWPATLVMEPKAEDSTYMLTLTATAESADGPIPIAAAPVAVYVKRMFSSLKVAEGETDESGMVELEFPAGLAGDAEGNLEITAMIEETDQYGNLTARMTEKWGHPVSYSSGEAPRALWSPHPPTWMVITFFILMGAVWGHYVIIVINLFRIRSEARHVAGDKR